MHESRELEVEDDPLDNLREAQQLLPNVLGGIQAREGIM